MKSERSQEPESRSQEASSLERVSLAEAVPPGSWILTPGSSP
jgi:hypothetical protein